MNTQSLATRVVATLLLPIPLFGQPRAIRLSSPLVSSPAAYTDLSSAVRLSDGSIMIADPGGRELAMLDGKTGKSRRVGREGSGPGEYRDPHMLLPYKGGALLFDAGLRRVSTYNANGEFAGSVPYPPRQAASSVEMTSSMDTAGFVYFNSPFIHAATRELAIFTWQFPTGRIEEVTYVPKLQGPKFAAASKPSIGVGAPMSPVLRVPYSDWDAFIGLSDGTRCIGRSSQRSVEWWTREGRLISAQAFPYPRMEIPDSIRARVRPVQLQDQLEKYYPAFDAELAVRSAQDRVWYRAVPASTDSAVWFGFLRSEKQPQQLVLPRGSWIIGVFEPFFIIASRTDSDMQRVEVRRVQP
jgi:hypothetical protein